jgi:hypothetical protein
MDYVKDIAHLDGEIIEKFAQRRSFEIAVFELILLDILLPSRGLHKAIEHAFPVLNDLARRRRRSQHPPGLRYQRNIDALLLDGRDVRQRGQAFFG